MQRRFFLFAAPAIVASASLMRLSLLPQKLALMPVETDYTIRVGNRLLAWNGSIWTVVATATGSVRDSGSWAGATEFEHPHYYEPARFATELETRIIDVREADWAYLAPCSQEQRSIGGIPRLRTRDV